MGAEPINATELDAQTVEELRPPCEACNRDPRGGSAEWIITVECNHWEWPPYLMCSPHKGAALSLAAKSFAMKKLCEHDDIRVHTEPLR